METHEEATFLAALLRLAEASGTTLSEARQMIYLEDLQTFPLENVLEALTWSEKNLNDFPKIPQLLKQLEGDPVEHAEKAWQTMLGMLHIGHEATITVDDPILFETIRETWGLGWPKICYQFSQLTDGYEPNELRKRFVRNYQTAYGKRHTLTSGFVFMGTNEYRVKQGTFVGINYLSFYQVTDGKIRLVEKRPVEQPKGEPMPPELKLKLDQMMRELGKRPEPQLRVLPQLTPSTTDSDVNTLL